MVPYLVLLGTICIEGFLVLNSKNIKDRNKVFLILVTLELIVFTGLRSTELGSDTVAYVRLVDMFEGISFSEVWDISENPYNFEIGYLIFSKICSFLGLTGTKFLFVIAIVTYVPFCILIYKESKSPLISVLSYFTFSLFYYSLGIFRQMMALSICLLAIPALKSRNIVKYFIFIFFATMFHTTALCWIPLYWLASKDVSSYRKKIIPIGLICIPLGGVLVKTILLVLPKYSHYVGT